MQVCFDISNNFMFSITTYLWASHHPYRRTKDMWVCPFNKVGLKVLVLVWPVSCHGINCNSFKWQNNLTLINARFVQNKMKIIYNMKWLRNMWYIKYIVSWSFKYKFQNYIMLEWFWINKKIRYVLKRVLLAFS